MSVTEPFPAIEAALPHASEPLLVVDDLAKHFVVRRTLLGRPTATVKAVDGVSLTLRAGETLAVVGESGCGKSTVGRLLLRLIEPTAGSVRFEGRALFDLPEREVRAFRRHAQLIFQDPFASLNPRMRVGDLIAEPLMLHNVVPSAQRRERVGELLELVGLRPEQAVRLPHEFSGGQRQRIVIARAIAAEPKLIVCDEAVSALDVSIRAGILNLLRDLQARLGLAYLFISHDLAVVKHIATHVAVMYLGRIVETAPADELFANPRHPYTRALLSAIPVASPGARRQRLLLEGDVPSPVDPPPGCHLHPRCPFAADVCRTTRPGLLSRGGAPSHLDACHRSNELPPAGPLMAREAPPSPALERLIAAFASDGPPLATAGASLAGASLASGPGPLA